MGLPPGPGHRHLARGGTCGHPTVAGLLGGRSERGESSARGPRPQRMNTASLSAERAAARSVSRGTTVPVGGPLLRGPSEEQLVLPWCKSLPFVQVNIKSEQPDARRGSFLLGGVTRRMPNGRPHSDSLLLSA